MLKGSVNKHRLVSTLPDREGRIKKSLSFRGSRGINKNHKRDPGTLRGKTPEEDRLGWEDEEKRRCFSVVGIGQPMTPCSPGDKKKWNLGREVGLDRGKGWGRIRMAGAQTPRPKGRGQRGRGTEGLTGQTQKLRFIS